MHNMPDQAQQNGGPASDQDTSPRQTQSRSASSRRHLHFLEPERRPLLRRHISHEVDPEPVFSCSVNAHSHLPVYTNIHRIRRDVVSIVEDYMTLEQLRDLRINLSVIRPLVDQLYELDDISIGKSLCPPVFGHARILIASPQSTASWSTGLNSCMNSRT